MELSRGDREDGGAGTQGTGGRGGGGEEKTRGLGEERTRAGLGEESACGDWWVAARFLPWCAAFLYHARARN